MAVVEKYLIGSVASLMTTELNSLANNALAVASSAYDNTAGAAGDGYVFCDLELVVTFGTAPTANTGVSCWFLRAVDGTNYESSSATPIRSPDAVFGADTVTTAQRLVRRDVRMPFGPFKALIKNDGTGQAFAASGNTLKVRPCTYEGA